MLVHSSNLNSLQYLRVFAIFAVFFLHTNNPYAIGHFGVDIFFVISGYVMAMIATKDVQPAHFMKDRIFRIVPLYWATTFLTFFVALLLASKMDRTVANVEDLFLSLFFIPFYRFPNEVIPLYGLGWSLMFEMLFYIAMFIALLYKKYMNKQSNPLIFCFFLIFFLTFFASFMGKTNAVIQFIGSQNSYTFLFGIIAYWLNNKQTDTMKHFPISLYIVGLCVAIIACGLAEKYLMIYRGFSIGIPAFFVVLIATRIEFSKVFSLPKRLQAALIYLAEISFAFYLTHIFIVMGMKKIGANFLPFLAPDTVIGATFAFIIAIVVATMTHILFDKPLNRWLRATFNAKPSKVVLA